MSSQMRNRAEGCTNSPIQTVAERQGNHFQLCCYSSLAVSLPKPVGCSASHWGAAMHLAAQSPVVSSWCPFKFAELQQKLTVNYLVRLELWVCEHSPVYPLPHQRTWLFIRPHKASRYATRDMCNRRSFCDCGQ